MAVEKYGSKTDVVVKLVLVFFVSLLSFSIGTFVGKKFSDNQHKLSQFEPEMNGGERGVASIPPEGDEVKPKDALNNDEIAKLAEEFVNDDEGHKAEPAHEAAPVVDKNSANHTEAKAETPAAHEPAHPGPAVAVHETHAVAKVAAATHEAHPAAEPMSVTKRVVQNMTPEPEHVTPKAQSRIPQSLPKELATSALGKYTVQIASYPNEEEAQKSASDLKDKGFSAFYVSAKVKDKTWYRVSVGLFNSAKEADAYKKDLLSRAKVTSAIIQKITN